MQRDESPATNDQTPPDAVSVSGSTVAIMRRGHCICNEFESRWGTPNHADIEGLIAGEIGAERDLLLQWLIQSELEIRQDRGELLSPDDFLPRFPRDADVILRAFRTLESDPVPSDVAGPQSAASVAPTDGDTVKARRSDRGPPSEFGSYEILNEIARGGMGIVYRARHTTLNRVVALKVILAGQLASDVEIERFRKEAQAIAALDHPGVVPVYEVGESGGYHFFSMLLMEGGSLAEKIANGPLTASRAAETVASVARAVHFAHGQGIVHRDLKPRNILLDRNERPRVTDFGLAKFAAREPGFGEGGRHSNSEPTHSGQILGTPGYMAPEQATGRSGATCERSDVYSLGAVLYALVTGRPPFQAATPIETLRQLLDQRVVAPRSLNAKIPIDLETITLKCLAKSPSDRYASADEVANDLQRFLDGRPISARPVPAWIHAWQWVRRQPVGAMLILACSALIVVGLFYWFVKQDRDTARRAEHAAMRAERDALIQGHLTQAIADRLSDQPGARGRALDQIRQAAALRPTGPARFELQRQAITVLATQDVRFDRRPGKFEFASNTFAFDPAHRVFANVTTDAAIVLRQAADFTELRRFPADGIPRNASLRFSEQAQFLAALGGGNVAVWRVDDAARVYRSDERDGLGIDLSRDERWLSVCHRSRRIDVVDLQHPAAIRSITGLDHPATRALFSPDGTRLLVGYGFSRKRPEIYDVATLGRTTILHRSPGLISTLAWHPDGQRVAIAEVGGHVGIWDVGEDRLLFELPGQMQTVDGLEFHPTEPLLRTESWDGMTRLWDTTAGRRVASFAGIASIRSWSRNGQILGCSFTPDHVDYILQEPLEVFRQLDATSFGSPVISSSAGTGPLRGRLLVGTNYDDVVICDSTTGRALARVRPHAPRLATFNHAADSLWLACGRGLARLPVRVNGDQVVIGPPQWRLQTNDWIHATISANGQVFAATRNSPHVLDAWELGNWLELASGSQEIDDHPVATSLADTPAAIRLPDQHDMIALSPDGRWAATGYWHADSVSVWDLKERKLGHELACGKQTYFRFMPNSQYLVTSRFDAFRIHDLASWRCIRTIPRVNCSLPGRITFSQDGQLAAAEMEPGIIDLISLAPFERLLRLEPPNPPNSFYLLEFSPDNARLHFSSLLPSVVGFWDLRKVRARLLDLGLDWDRRLDPLLEGVLPDEFGPPSTKMSVRFEGVEYWQGESSVARMTDEGVRQALLDAEQAWEADSDSADSAAELAWQLLMAPPQFRDPPRALKLAKDAMRGDPPTPVLAIIVGLAQFRLGNFDEAEEVLRSHLNLQDDDSLPFALYTLALSLQAQGKTHEATIYFDWGTRAERASNALSRTMRADLDVIADETRATIADRDNSPD